jgi:uncharacterized protein (DUF1697 family)
MKTYIVLLRGINVSGQKKIKMNDLKDHLSFVGLSDVTTYIQSGNLIVRCDCKKQELKQIVEETIQNIYNFHVPVKILNTGNLKKTIENNPYLLEKFDKKYIYISFLFEIPEPGSVKKIEDIKFNEDKFIIMDDIIFTYCPGGAGKTKFNNNFFEKKLKVTATTRNWKTTHKLLELADK